MPTGKLLLLPALDVAGGRAVRPGGQRHRAPDTDPFETALAWQREGAEWIHLVDLDAAYGRGSNADLLAGIVGALDVPVQLSGGIRTRADVEQGLATGAARVNLATSALLERREVEDAIAAHGDRICVGLDVRDNRLVPRGEGVDVGPLTEALDWLTEAGACRYVVTDVETDGAMTGPNTGLLELVAAATGRPIVASGGVASLADLQALCRLVPGGVEGVVLGTALAAGAFTLGEALRCCAGTPNSP